MFRRLLLSGAVFVVSIVALPLFAACDLQMAVSCTPGAHGGPASCTATTVNNGTSSCTGLGYSMWYAPETASQVHLSEPHTSLNGLNICFDSGLYEDFDYALSFCYGNVSIGPGRSFTSRVDITGATADTALISVTWVGDETGKESGSAYAFANVAAPSCTPNISSPPLTLSGLDYTVSWTAVADVTAQYIVEESTTADFSANVTQTQTQSLSKTFRHDNPTASTTWYYRVKATHCSGGEAAYSRVTKTVVQALPRATTDGADVALPLGTTTPVQFTLFVPPPANKTAATLTFTASMDKPYLGVSPASGTFPAEGLTLTITARPAELPAGASTGTLHLTTTAVSSSGTTTNANTSLNIPVSVSLVTPVTPGGKSLPPANALMIPVVTHVNGTGGQFLSDVRLTNAAAAPITYQVTLTPTNTNATQSSKVTQITVDSQQTVALNDIAKNFFGFGATGTPQDTGFGSLEIRPINTSSPLTFASSRTYFASPNGTLGQFIAAVPFSKFATKRTTGLPGGPPPSATPALSLQHVAQSARFRTNVGLAEGAGEAANGRIRIFDAAGSLLKEVPYSLQPGEQQQMNRFISDPAKGGISTLEDGRLEITVDSPAGAVTAYASVLDQTTTDPLAVMPVDVSKVSATKYVVPGIAELPNRVDNFHSDIRLFNGGASATPVTLTFYPQDGSAPLTAPPRSVNAGEMLVLDNVLPTLFNVAVGGGSVVITTPSATSLVATARTYTNVATGGTFGQFIPGVTSREGVGAGERGLQVMQLEQSDHFRSNLGLAELTGNPAEVRVSLVTPESKVTASVNVKLAGHQFTQLGRVIQSFMGNEAQVYNARVVVEVVGGTGRVTAYGSVIDNESKDPTYVPAQ